MKEPDVINRKADGRLGAAPLLGVIQGASFSDLCRLLVLLVKVIAHRFFIAFLKLRYAIFKTGIKIRMCLIKCRIVCLQRGYLPPNKSKLAPKFVYWCVACLNHPVEVANVVKNSFHIVMCDLTPNDQAHLSAPGGRVERNQKEQ